MEKEKIYIKDIKCLIEYKREENGDRLRNIVKGVFSVTSFYKLYKGQYIEDKIVIDRILKRVGLDPTEVEMIILKKDAERFVQREKIYEAYNNKEYDKAERLLCQYEMETVNEHQIHRQFVKKMQVLIMRQRNGNVNLQIAVLKDAIACTVPEFGIKPLEELCLAPEEMELFVLLASCYRKKNQLIRAKKLLEQVFNYMKGRNISQKLICMYMPYTCLELSKVYGIKEQYEDARYYAITGIKILYANAALPYLVALQDQYIKLEKISERKRKLSAARRKQLRKIQLEKEIITQLYEECKLNPYWIHSIEKYEDCYVFNELIQRYRELWNMSKGEFRGDICSNQSFFKIETEGGCPVKTFSKWMEKMGLPPTYYITQLHGANTDHIRKKARIDQYIKRNQYKKAEFLFDQLEEEFKEARLIEECPENHQYFLRVRTLLERELHGLSMQQDKDQLEQALKYTIPEYPDKCIEKRILLKQETKVLNSLITRHVKEKNYEKTLSVWSEVIKSYQKNVLYGYVRYDDYNMVLVNYISMLGSNKRYEESSKMAYESICHFLKLGTLERIARCCYNISWNREQEMIKKHQIIEKDSICENKLKQALVIANMIKDSFYIQFLKEYGTMIKE